MSGFDFVQRIGLWPKRDKSARELWIRNREQWCRFLEHSKVDFVGTMGGAACEFGDHPDTFWNQLHTDERLCL